MEKKDIKDILNKVESGEFDPKEEQIAKLWLFQLHNKNRVKLSESELDTANQQIWNRLKDNISPKPYIAKLWPKIVAITAAIVLIVSGLYIFNYNKQTTDNNTNLITQDIAPGTVGATLTLGNGKRIKLSEAANGEIAKEAGISVTKTAAGQLVYEVKASTGDAGKINTLTTAKGETYILTLPDKSKVWLNAASSLTYSASLNGPGLRRVKLEGEAYFEIAKDKQHPFIVKTRQQEVEVLGTHFNISSYADDEVERTTLLEGSVRLTVSGVSGILKPGQQGKVKDGKIAIEDTDTDLAVAWKNNEFVFESETVENIMKMVERWYNVEVIYVGEKTKGKFSGGVSRFDNISKVLLILEETGAGHFKIHERKIYVSK